MNVELDNEIEVNFTYYKNFDARSYENHYKMPLSKFYSGLSEAPVIKNKKMNGLIVSGKVNGHRNGDNTEYKNMLIFDYDDLPAHYDMFGELSSNWPYGFAIYTSYKHTDTAPRYRIVIPIDRNLSNEAYESVMKKIQVEYFSEIPGIDNGSFEYSRGFYMPGVPSENSAFIFEYQDEPIFTVTDDFIEQARAQFPPVLNSSYKPLKTSEEWQAILSSKNDHEGRNTALTQLAGHLFRRYVHEDIIYYLLSLWNDHHHEPMETEEFNTAFKSIRDTELERRNLEERRQKYGRPHNARRTKKRRTS